MSQLITRRIERVSKTLLEEYSKQVTQLIGKQHGVYALYNDSELYYVGKAVDLKRRVKQHLKDRHLAQWTHFSIFLVEDNNHVAALEALLISIANPKGNRAKPIGGIDSSLKKELEKLVKTEQDSKREAMFTDSKSKTKQKAAGNGVRKNPSLKARFKGERELIREYKGVEYKAVLTVSGQIRYNNRFYDSPSGAAKAIVDRGTVNGWSFWYIKDDDNNWVRLKDLDS